jgi:hypothetical protein
MRQPRKPPRCPSERSSERMRREMLLREPYLLFAFARFDKSRCIFLLLDVPIPSPPPILTSVPV